MSESGEDINAPINGGDKSNNNGNVVAIIKKSDASNNNNDDIPSPSSQFVEKRGSSAFGSYENRKSAYLESVTSLKDLPSCEFRQSIRSSAILKDGDVDMIAAANFNNGGITTSGSWLHATFTFITKGGTSFDGFLLAASQEVGQVIVTLPWVFSLVGMTSGIILQFIFATAALYTNYLLVNLHTEFRKRLAADKDDPRYVFFSFLFFFLFFQFYSFRFSFLLLFSIDCWLACRSNESIPSSHVTSIPFCSFFIFKLK
jgi:hypothetical protein